METPPTMGGCMGGWVEGWVNGSGHVKSLKIEILGSESFTRWLISNASARDSTSASDIVLELSLM